MTLKSQITLSKEMTDLILKSKSLFEEMRPLLDNGRENESAIMNLNDQRLQIDTKLGSLLRQASEQD